MKASESGDLIRAVLGDLSPDELRKHRERMIRDPDYRARFEQLAATRTDLLELVPPALDPGLDMRVLAALRARRGPNALESAMARMFWRLAGPALTMAMILVLLAVRSDSSAVQTDTVSLSAWYPMSSDPTVQP